jgi:hypothetical protein
VEKLFFLAILLTNSNRTHNHLLLRTQLPHLRTEPLSRCLNLASEYPESNLIKDTNVMQNLILSIVR